MESKEAAQLASIFHFPAGITITSIHPSATELVVHIACQNTSMSCPACDQPSSRIHGHYQRTNGCRSALRRPERASDPHRAQICVYNTNLLTEDFYRAAQRAGLFLCPDDQQAHRTCPNAGSSGRWTSGHTLGRPIRYCHQPVYVVTPSDATSCSGNTSCSGTRSG